MPMDLQNSLSISASGLRAQSLRMRIIAENIANQDSISPATGVDPYRRKIVSFRNVLNATTGVPQVAVDKVARDSADFGRKYMPGHPAADATGYVTTPNVNGIIEMTDMREAQRSYEANLSVIEGSKALLQRTVDLLR
jgi:flagellar basal-body rod protein FlgC